jgi:hypothetical protein
LRYRVGKGSNSWVCFNFINEKGRPNILKTCSRYKSEKEKEFRWVSQCLSSPRYNEPIGKGRMK